MKAANEDFQVSLPLERAPDVNEEKLNTDHDRFSSAGLLDLASGPRDPAPAGRDGGRGARGRGAGGRDPAVEDQTAELADEAAEAEGDLALVRRAIRTAAGRAPVVGGLRVAQLPVGVRITMGNADLLFQPPLLVRNDVKGLSADAKNLVRGRRTQITLVSEVSSE